MGAEEHRRENLSLETVFCKGFCVHVLRSVGVPPPLVLLPLHVTEDAVEEEELLRYASWFCGEWWVMQVVR